MQAAYVVVLKTGGIVFMLLSLLCFASDLLPVDGFSFSGESSEYGDHRLYKIVSTQGINFLMYGLVFFLLGICMYFLPTLIKKNLGKQRGT